MVEAKYNIHIQSLTKAFYQNFTLGHGEGGGGLLLIAKKTRLKYAFSLVCIIYFLYNNLESVFEVQNTAAVSSPDQFSPLEGVFFLKKKQKTLAAVKQKCHKCSQT